MSRSYVTKNVKPSTGGGLFDAAYDPQTGQMVVTVRIAFKFANGNILDPTWLAAVGGIAGILSERDVVRRLGEEGPAVLARRVSELMTHTVETCGADDTAFHLLGRMTDGRFRHMPVLDEDGGMAGILSIGDVVKARLEEIEAENAAMADMLSS